MIIDDTIVKKYLSGQMPETYKDCWIYNALGRGYTFETPNSSYKNRVSKLYDKLVSQIHNFIPKNYELVKRLFPDFDDAVNNYTIMLVVGFPDPYDAMVLSHNAKEYMVFDLIQFGQDSLKQEYNCHSVLTHELIHICLHKKHQRTIKMSYLDSLDYKAFDEGFAHALACPEEIYNFQFNDFVNEKYNEVKNKLKKAIAETDIKKQRSYLVSADTGDYWNKFASISGKLYILKNARNIYEIYNDGWEGFTKKILES
jgi:hypothetical protein